MPGGQTISNVLLFAVAGSRSPSRAQAWTTLPPFWTMVPSSIGSPSGGRLPVSSSNSRRATATSSSSPSASPLGIVQWPASRFVKNGPPG